jgi:hypothetical protein
MLNQFVLVGKLLAIYDKYFVLDIEISARKRGKVAISLPPSVSNLLDNKDVGDWLGVKGHIQSVVEDGVTSMSFICERVSNFGKGGVDVDE